MPLTRVAFLINQSVPYIVTTITGIIEFWVEYYFFPE